jgi:serine/threonine protein kinase
MNQDPSKPGEAPFIPPVSVFSGPIAELVGHRLLSPPTRPGLLASLARYEVVRVLGGGGMGVVVFARDSEQGKDVAIKLIRPELVSDQRMVHRFVKEAGHLQKLKHPNVVPVLEVSDRPEGPYFVMPYFERGSLASRIRPGQPMEAVSILDIARQVADGLLFAHRHGIIHRDLKPANILIGADGAGCCLADFGLARTMFNDTIIDVEREQLEGTAPYMSPGVAAGNAEDTRCDIYAFGALLYEMLTGEPPYAGRNTADIRKQILAGPPKPILERNPAADRGLVAVAEGAMARELRDRYADMADVLADLDRIKAGKPVIGARGIVGRVKHSRPTLWVPVGIVLIAAGLWLLWPPAPEKKAASTPPVAPVSPVVVTPTPKTSAPPVVVIPPVTSAPPRQPLPHPPVIVPTIAPPVQPRKAWQVAVLAGNPALPGSADGPAATARFRSPGGIAVDTRGNLYVADTGNNVIRKLGRGGSVSTLAGLAGQTGSRDGQGTAASFLAPMGITVDQAGNVYVAEFADNTIRKITPDGLATTLAGSAGNPGSDDARGDNAHFRNPWSVAADTSGNVYVADRGNFVIRQVTADGLVITFAGFAGVPGKTDGPGTYARFHDPLGIAAGPSGLLYVADPGNGVRTMARSGMVSTPAWNTGPLTNAQCLTVDGQSNILVFDGSALKRITPDGTVKTLPDTTLNDGHGNRIRPTSLAVDLTGNLDMVDLRDHAVWQVMLPYRLRAQR